jgi:hypothetical protein
MADGDQPKIIIDDDWKSQAQAEKARLAEAAKAKETPGKPPEDHEPLGFLDLVRMFATQALMYLGAYPDPETGRAMVSLEIAKLNIDLLGVLEEKTRGNLSTDEKEVLEGTLHELRIQYVEIARAIKKASDEGRIGPDGMMHPAAPGAGRPPPAGPLGGM